MLLGTLLAVFGSSISAQTTAFSYQGSLKDGGNLANGAFQMQFKLFDSLGGAGQVGSTITDVPVTASQGVFSVKLDFGANALSGANRWLEIAVRHNAGEAYTTLSPREQIASSPYSVRTLSAASADTATTATTATNALNLGGVAANQYVQTNDARLSDARNPLPNSPNYIQNTLSQQAASNFNVSGSGTVGTFNANGAATFGGVGSPANAPAGQGRVYFDSGTNKFRISESGGAFINLVGSGAVSGTGTVGAIPFWSAATTLGSSAIAQFGTNIGIGTATPAHKLAAVGGPCWTSDCWGGALELDNASAIGWRQNTSGVKFGIGRTEAGLFFFRTDSPLGTTTNGAIYDFKMDNSGNVGIGPIGINTDLTGAKLNLFTGTSSYGFTHTDGVITVGSFLGGLGGPNPTPAGGWFGTRSNHPLYFFNNNGAPRMTINTSGNVGIGTSAPTARLQVGSAGDTANSYTTRFQSSPNVAGGGGILFDQNSIYGWKVHTENTGFPEGTLNFNYINISTGASQTSNPLVLTGNGNVGIGTTTPNAKLQIAGDVTQPSFSSGLAKAMIYYNGISNVIVRCFNGIDLSLSVNCHFSVSRVSGAFFGRYVVNFGFSVVNRFAIVTGNGMLAMVFNTGNSNEQEVQTFDVNGTFTDSNFTIIIF